MPDYETIYREHADVYNAMVAREDYAGRLLPALNRIRSLAGLDVIEMGAGTGRITRLLAPVVKSIAAFDREAAMLGVAAKTLTPRNGHLAVGDNRRLPAADRCADVALAGWSLGHAQRWYPDTWSRETDQAVDEMRRVLRPGGTILIIETLGTGRETPQPPHAGLAAYYAYLESRHGFARTWIRTDYKFESLEEEERLIRFFFGDEMADRLVREYPIILPECTGIWSSTIGQDVQRIEIG